MKLKAITLDLDDTLWPVAQTIARAELALKQFLNEQAPNTALIFHRDNIMRWRKQVSASYPERKNDLSFLRHALIQAGLSEAGDDPKLADPAFAVFFEARQSVVLFDDALPALTRLAAAVPIVALSNGNADIKKIGIDQYFAGRVSSSTLPHVKPHQKVYEYAAGLAKASLADTLHVGDDVALDVIGAHRAGMRTAWIHRENQSWEQAYEHQSKLHAQYGLHVQDHHPPQANERPSIIANNLLDMIEQLERKNWL